MTNLRAENFTEIEAIYANIKNLIQKCKGINEKIIVSGLQKINTAIRRIVNYQAINEEYWKYIAGAATAMNCLLNVQGWRLCKTLKEALLSVFNRLAAILPDNFQLNLFEASEEFGWRKTEEEETTIPKTTDSWYSLIKKLTILNQPEWLLKLLRRDWISNIEGRQLTLADAR